MNVKKYLILYHVRQYFEQLQYCYIEVTIKLNFSETLSTNLKNDVIFKKIWYPSKDVSQHTLANWKKWVNVAPAKPSSLMKSVYKYLPWKQVYVPMIFIVYTQNLTCTDLLDGPPYVYIYVRINHNSRFVYL